MRGEAYPFANALYQWEEGDRRLGELITERGAGEPLRAVEAIRDELRRRLGPTYTAEQLAEVYGAGTDWCLDVASRAAPGAASMDPQALADGAFFEHLRGAVDWAGGRIVAEDESEG